MLRFKGEIDKHEFQESVQKGHGRARMRGAYHSWEFGREKNTTSNATKTIREKTIITKGRRMGQDVITSG